MQGALYAYKHLHLLLLQFNGQDVLVPFTQYQRNTGIFIKIQIIYFLH